MSRLTRHNTLAFALACACAVPTAAFAQTGGEAQPSDPAETGGTQFVPPPPPPSKAKIDSTGHAIAPAGAPRAVVRMIEAANMIVGKPYRYGGGHKPYVRASRSRRSRSSVVLDSGYDCSGSVSFALYGARLLRSPLDSRSFASWGLEGTGRWVTVYTNPGHAYIVIAGLRFDTSMRDDPSRTGPAWSKRLRVSDSFQARHPRNL